jgi:pimeloyl-ACP methyl ester carboxylesterase
MRSLASLVAGLVTELGHEQVDVLGLSWGGAMAQELAYRHPEAVRRLVLAATMPGWISVPGRPLAVSILMSPLRYYSSRYFELVAPTLYGGEVRQAPGLLREHAAMRSEHPPSPIGYYYQIAALRRWTSVPWLHRLPHRTLVLAGDDDPIISLANGRLLACRIPASELHLVEGGGHLFMFTRPAEVAERIREFLDRGDSVTQ